MGTICDISSQSILELFGYFRLDLCGGRTGTAPILYMRRIWFVCFSFDSTVLRKTTLSQLVFKCFPVSYSESMKQTWQLCFLLASKAYFHWYRKIQAFDGRFSRCAQDCWINSLVSLWVFLREVDALRSRGKSSILLGGGAIKTSLCCYHILLYERRCMNIGKKGFAHTGCGCYLIQLSCLPVMFVFAELAQ